MDVFNAETDEELAVRIGIPLRSLSRYKKGDGMTFERTVELLDLAGWLLPDEASPDPPHAQMERARRVAVRLADEVEALAGTLRPPT